MPKLTKETITRFDYLSKLIAVKDKTDLIKVITGIRRCGKSTLMGQFRDYLLDCGVQETHIVEMNFESMGMSGIKNKDGLYRAIADKIQTGTTYLLLDEIQHVEDWETAVNSARIDFNVDIYITGSNSKILSSSLSKDLTGRFFEVHLLPLSLSEFMLLNGTKDTEKATVDYLERGALPIISADYTDDIVRELLSGIYNSILFKDIMSSNEVRDPVLLENMVEFLLDNIGNTVSPTAISKYVGKDVTIVDRYLKLITSSYLFYKVKSYDLKGKKLLKTQAKYYCADLGIRNAVIGKQYGDKGRIMENLVFLELMRRGYEVRIGKYGDKEIDFTARKGSEVLYVQVTLSLESEYNLEREMAPFYGPKDHYHRMIITGDKTDRTTHNGVEIVGITDFLSEL